MGNIFESFASGLGKAIGSIFHAPVDFLAGKSCSTNCGQTWDLTCYIENFCIANLLKLALILLVVYMVFLFIYLTYKLRVFHCICCCVFKTTWTCCSTCFYACAGCCHCLCHELSSVKRRPRRTHLRYGENFKNDEDHGRVFEGSSNSIRFHNDSSLHGRSRMRRHHRKGQSIRKSLKPRNHSVRVGIRREHEHDYGSKKRHGSIGGDVHHGVKVTRSTRFAHKSTSFRRQK